jgi:hypothetical protein
MAISTYSTGTVAIAANATSVVGTGSNWTGQNAMPGDFLVVAGNTVMIQDVTDALHLVIDAWPYTAVTAGTAYSIKKSSPLRFAGGQTMVAVDQMVTALNTSGFFFFVGPTEAEPDPSFGNDGQFAFQPSTGKYWVKTSGVWVSSGPPGVGYGGTSTTSLAIATGSKAFTTQSGLGYDGARVRVTSAANHSNWMEGNATYSGTTLTVVVDKVNGSGTHADWSFAIAGVPGAGDLVSTNNLSDIANAATARGNLAAAKSGANSDITSLSGLTTALSVAQGGTGDTGTGWTAYTPTAVVSGGTAAASGRFKRIGKTVFISVNVNVSVAGSLSAVTLPGGIAVSSSGSCCLVGREIARTGVAWIGMLTSGATTIATTTASNTNAVSVADDVVLSGVFEAA